MKDSYILYIDKLQGSYKEKFLEVEKCCTIMMNGYDWDAKDDLLNDILDVFLNAQKDNRDINEIIGNNTVNFCSKFIETVSKPKSIIKNFLNTVHIYSWILIYWIFVEMLGKYISGNTDIWNMHVNIANWIIFLVIVPGVLIDFMNILLMIIIKHNYRNNNFSLKKEKKISYVSFVAIVLISAIFFYIFEQNKFFQIQINASIGLLICILYIIFYRFIKKFWIGLYEIKGNVKIFKINDDIIIEGIKRNYSRLSKKNLKKNDEILTTSKFIELERNNNIKIEKRAFLQSIIIILIITVVSTILIPFDTEFDKICYIVSLLLLEGIIVFGIDTLTKKTHKKENIILNKMEIDSIDIDNIDKLKTEK